MTRGGRLRRRDVAAVTALALLFAWGLAAVLLPRGRASRAEEADAEPPSERAARALPDLPDPVAARPAPPPEERAAAPAPARPVAPEAPAREAAPRVAERPAAAPGHAGPSASTTTALVEGRVVYASGRPRLVRARLLLESAAPETLAEVRGMQLATTEDGTFRFDGIPPGRWRVRALVPNPGDEGAAEVDLRAGDRKSLRIELELAPNAGLLSGKVAGDMEGRPGTIVVAHGATDGAPHRARRAIAGVGGDGGFEVRLGTGLYRIQLELGARPDDPAGRQRPMPCADALVDVPKDGTAEVELTVAPAVTLARRVPGTPPVLALAPMDPASAEPVRATPSADAEYVFADVAAPSSKLARAFVLVPLAGDPKPWPGALADFGRESDRLPSSGFSLARVPLRGLSADELERAQFRAGAGPLSLEGGPAREGMVEAPREEGPHEMRVSVGPAPKQDAAGWTFLRWGERDPAREVAVPAGRARVRLALDGGGGALHTVYVEPAEVPAPLDGAVYAQTAFTPGRDALSLTLPEGTYRISAAFWGGKRIEVRDRGRTTVRLWAGKEQQMLLGAEGWLEERR